MAGGAMRRALPLLAALGLLASGLAACGGGGGAPSATVDVEADAAVVNEVLGRQLAAVAAYERVLPSLDGADRALARRFRAQEQQHVDATTKALRGLGAAAEPPAETIAAQGLKGRAACLEFLYEMESATIDAELGAIAKLTLASPRPLLASMAANQAERLVLIRRALGVKASKVIPSAFENGRIAAP